MGVARQYSGTLGKTANCQVAVSLHQVAREAAAILNWRLYLPESWTQDPPAARRSGHPRGGEVPDEVATGAGNDRRGAGLGFAVRMVVADAGYGEVTEFREGLETRHLPYAVGIPPPCGCGRNRPGRAIESAAHGTSADCFPLRRAAAVAVQEVAAAGPRVEESALARRQQRLAGVALLRCSRPARARIPRRRRPSRRSGCWWNGRGEQEPTKYFLCDLPEHYTLRRLVRVVKSRWKIEQDYQQLKEELGLDHYEGRNWTGWHHHVTLVMLAHAFLTLEMLRSKKNFWVDPATDAS